MWEDSRDGGEETGSPQNGQPVSNVWVVTGMARQSSTAARAAFMPVETQRKSLITLKKRKPIA